MASDLSNILKNELSNTIEQLLAKKVAIKDIAKFDDGAIESSVLVEAKFEFKNISSTWSFFIPSTTGAKFEYLMLGGMGELKKSLDDEISDAIKEIISNICGSMATSINAQDFDDLGKVKTEVSSVSIENGDKIKSYPNIYKIVLDLDDEELFIFISFDEIIKPYIAQIRGEISVDEQKSVAINKAQEMVQPTVKNGANNAHTYLDEHSISNLKLLFDIKLKLSVRLGTKVLLLKDILRWDVGEIIELEQMVNEPLDILVNGVKVGEGEAVVVEGKFGLKVKYIGDEKSRLKKLGLV
ncbi:MAG: flagellar motor switch protein FliY [Arcobacter butzleri]|nr:FliM/FliN family flagellar motor switch protein [Arcobacteraceae bacterium]MDY0365550.1 FliM/FliN family flagellar motor switch protein [Arcobacteraceae bacterium]NLO16690.1 flagellar motor switch protein FliY [Aliarcobacter butzleri]